MGRTVRIAEQLAEALTEVVPPLKDRSEEAAHEANTAIHSLRDAIGQIEHEIKWLEHDIEERTIHGAQILPGLKTARTQLGVALTTLRTTAHKV